VSNQRGALRAALMKHPLPWQTGVRTGQYRILDANGGVVFAAPVLDTTGSVLATAVVRVCNDLLREPDDKGP
jgi:hypothetical protein